MSVRTLYRRGGPRHRGAKRPEILAQEGYTSASVAEAPVREVFPGIRLRPLWTGTDGAHADVLEMDPGTSWPRRDVHEPGPEEVYVVASRTGCTLFLFYPEG